jgi:hypothetical protein
LAPFRALRWRIERYETRGRRADAGRLEFLLNTMEDLANFKRTWREFPEWRPYLLRYEAYVCRGVGALYAQWHPQDPDPWQPDTTHVNDQLVIALVEYPFARSRTELLHPRVRQLLEEAVPYIDGPTWKPG